MPSPLLLVAVLRVSVFVSRALRCVWYLCIFVASNSHHCLLSTLGDGGTSRLGGGVWMSDCDVIPASLCAGPRPCAGCARAR